MATTGDLETAITGDWRPTGDFYWRPDQGSAHRRAHDAHETDAHNPPPRDTGHGSLYASRSIKHTATQCMSLRTEYMHTMDSICTIVHVHEHGEHCNVQCVCVALSPRVSVRGSFPRQTAQRSTCPDVRAHRVVDGWTRRSSQLTREAMPGTCFAVHVLLTGTAG